MRLIDLEYIFNSQIKDHKNTEYLLYYMLIEDGVNHIQRWPANKLDELLVTLDNFQFRGYTEKMPRFMK